MTVGWVQLSDGTVVECVCPPELAVRIEDLCVVEVERIPEYGRLMRLEASAAGSPSPPGRLLRRATLQDQARAAENAVMTKIAQEVLQRALERHRLRIHLVRVRYSFDRSVLTVLYVGEGAPEVRLVTREVAQELGTRVDLRPVGVRDEAAVLGGLGICGRVLCCRVWLRRFAPVNVRMAKAQRLSLNPTAITGQCGRLKCCLRYEYPLYFSRMEGDASAETETATDEIGEANEVSTAAEAEASDQVRTN